MPTYGVLTMKIFKVHIYKADVRIKWANTSKGLDHWYNKQYMENSTYMLAIVKIIIC